MKKFDEIVDFSGVEKFLDTTLKHYSSGMQLRLAFAVAAFLEPEILIIDALQWKKHPTHFTIAEALAAAARIGSRETFFTHIAHALGHEATNRQLPDGTALAHDGQRITSPFPSQ